ncbi:putative membrane protein [Lysobacter antibioticus]|uniref:hypothetical protein n=1 Tax=Lysobacter antibioticus TaxID=84531 RepID=UPI0007174030|nr:hypothetical protein [Lysobacter antibioticus]ALN63939.1 putative membrane protein [Lysobacter antibioticus]
MNPYAQLILIASLTVIVAAPILFGAVGGWRSRSVASTAAASPAGPWRWQRTFHSSLLYALSFSLIFFIQELFLVVPKALTPGLRATLYHNNHNWTGDNPLAHLFQGTGALAILLTALGFVAWLKLRPPRTEAVRLFAIWMAFHGFFQSLPQVVVGAVVPQNDVGMAFGYLQLADTTKLVAGLIALVVIAALATRFAAPLLALARDPAEVATPGRRSGFMFRMATLPALLALPLIVAMRVPGSLDQVAIVPVAEFVIGVFWLQGYAWCVQPRGVGQAEPASSIWGALSLVIAQLLIFQFALRPGIAFY